MKINSIVRSLRIQVVAIAMVLTIGTVARGQGTVGYGELPLPTGLYGPIIFTMTNDFTSAFDVPNVAAADYVKRFWMQVTMNAMSGFPQAPGEAVNPALWPTISAPGSITAITAVSDLGYGNPVGPWAWYVTATITPQPGQETVAFPTSWWNAYGSSITRIDVYTTCVPEPSVFALTGVGLAALWIFRRRR